MPEGDYDIAIIGAGIAGVSAAEALSRFPGLRIALLDDQPPLSVTSDKSTECYRNWWPEPCLVQLMDRSIEILREVARETGNRIRLNQRGYLYATAQDPNRGFIAEATAPSVAGAGELRVNPSLAGHDGADLYVDRELIRQNYPYLSPDATAGLHVRSAGWLSAQQLGMFRLEQAKSRGLTLIKSKVTGIDPRGSRYKIKTAESEIIADRIVLAGGPMLPELLAMVGNPLPLVSELHHKVYLRDPRGNIPRDAPLTIWCDPITLEWPDEERRALAENPETRFLTEEFPAGVHCRPEGDHGDQVLILWTYHLDPVTPVFPPPEPPFHAEIALRGMARAIPGFARYLSNSPRMPIDGGYYTKAPDNRILVGPLNDPNISVIGGFSGYGIMASPAASELLAATMMGGSIPGYAADFAPARLRDSEYLHRLSGMSSRGQL